jgi:MoaA/NifB/PqqE/SkfB family radical SAM enzyme
MGWSDCGMRVRTRNMMDGLDGLQHEGGTEPVFCRQAVTIYVYLDGRVWPCYVWKFVEVGMPWMISQGATCLRVCQPGLVSALLRG